MSAVIVADVMLESAEQTCWFVLRPGERLGAEISGPFEVDGALEEARRLLPDNPFAGNKFFQGCGEWPFMARVGSLVDGTERNGTAIWRVELLPNGCAFITASMNQPCAGRLCFSLEQAKDVQVTLSA